MKKKMIVLVVAVLALAVGGVTAFAAESGAFSYLTGRQRSVARSELYAQADELPEDEQKAFLAENGIADTPYSEEAAASYCTELDELSDTLGEMALRLEKAKSAQREIPRERLPRLTDASHHDQGLRGDGQRNLVERCKKAGAGS